MSATTSRTAYREIDIVGYLNARITPNKIVQSAVLTSGDTVVTLVRGGSEAGSLKSLNAMSAGGETANANCGAPTEEQVISQVGGSQPGKKQEKLPEFTAKASNSVNWARRGGWFIVKIKAKYLAKGDVGQSGWVCLKSAPIEGGQFIPHPSPITGFTLNAD